MGIPGLLQFIKDAAEPVHVGKYRGRTVAVDTYCWLHRGAFSCAEKLAKGEATDQFVCYCMKLVDMLLGFGVKPVLVFDGRNLPSKRDVEKTRRERREANLQRGRQLLRDGRLSEARDCFSRCVNITPSMAHRLIKVARSRGVDCVVAPYEADAQLAFLSRSGLAQAVITEDSDLLAFGCRKVILKMDKQGNGLEVDQRNLGRCRPLGDVFTEEKFRYMCILSGCDYLASLHGIGLGKACKLMRLAKDPDILKVVRKMGQYLKMNLLVPDSYLQGFVRANNTFLYQLVFDLVRRKVVPLNPYPEDVDPTTLSYAGLHLGDDTGLQMALGNLDVNTLEKIDDFSPDTPAAQPFKPRSHSWNDSSASTASIWSRSFTAVPATSTSSPQRALNTRGQQRAVSTAGLQLPCRQLQLKRPRDDSSVSDQDLMQLYSSSHKRSRSDQNLDRSSSSHQPGGRFATLLQRRNPEAKHQATRSRFFSSLGPPAPAQVSEEKSSSGHGPDAPSSDLSDPIVSVCSVPPSGPSPSPPGPGSGSPRWGPRLFCWSSPSPSSSLEALRRFDYQKNFSSPKPPRPSEEPPSPGSRREDTEDRPEDTEDRPEDTEDRPDSPSSSVYFSQSQPHPRSLHKDEEPPHRENDMNPDLSPQENKPDSIRSKILGLSKPRTGRGQQGQQLGPARVSGLRKRPSPCRKNRLGVQTTISTLWKNFSFTKDGQKMTGWRRGVS